MEIQRYLDNPGALVSQCLEKLAPRGWNANTQFFLVFLGILGLHLWLVPILMESAGVEEPGDKLAEIPEASQMAATTSGNGEKSEPPSSGLRARKSEPVETLVLTDPPLVATPVSSKKKDSPKKDSPKKDEATKDAVTLAEQRVEPSEETEKPKSAVSAFGGENDAVELKSDPAAELLEKAKVETETEKPEPPKDDFLDEPAETSIAQASPVAEPVEEEKVEAKEEDPAASEPKLSDLVTEAKASSQAQAASQNSGTSPGLRTFRALR